MASRFFESFYNGVPAANAGQAISDAPTDATTSVEREMRSNDVQREQWFDNSLVPVVIEFMAWGFAVINAVSCFAWETGRFDDGLTLVHAMLVLQGRTPNLDFYSFYPPLGLYINAAMFSLLGRSVLMIRLVAAIFYIPVLLLVSRFFRRRFPSAQPVIPVILFLVAAAIGNSLALPPWPGLASSILALLTYLYSRYGKRNPLWYVGLSGALTGCALLYRINFGAYVVMVVALDLLIPWLPRGGGMRDGRHLKRDLITSTVYLAPLSVVFAAFCFAVYGRHAVGTVMNLVVAAQRLMKLRGFIELSSSTEMLLVLAVPAGWFFLRASLGAKRFSLKAFVPALAVITVLAIALGGRNHVSIVPIIIAAEIGAITFLHLFVYRLDHSEFCLLLFYCGLLHYYLSRADFYHWRLLPIGVALFFPFLVLPLSTPTPFQDTPSSSKGTAIAVLLTATFVCLVAFETRPVAAYIPKGFRLLADLARHPYMSDTDRILGPTPPGSEWLPVYTEQDEIRALRYLRAQSAPNDAIFVGVPDHSRIYMNNLRFYFLAGRPIGVHTFQLETRVATEAPVQQGVIHDLDQNKVKWVILDSAYWNPDTTFRAHRYVGSKLLDQYIASHYHEEARFGAYQILSRTKPEGSREHEVSTR